MKKNKSLRNRSAKTKKSNKLGVVIGWRKLGFIVLALLCSVGLWFYVADYDSIVEKTFYNIPVELLPPTKSDIVVEAGEGKLVNITVYGKKADINAIEPEQINAYVDVRNAPGDGEINAEINVELPDGINLVETNALSVTHVVVSLAIPTVKELPIDVQIVSGSWDDMYEPVPECLTCSKIDITGSASVIERVDRAVVNIEVGEMEHSKLIHGKKIELIDKNGDAVSQSYIKISDPNGNELANGKVDVYVQMFMEKELPVVVDFTGGIFSTSDANISCTPSVVKVRGSVDKIKKMENIAIPVDETAIENEYNAVLSLPDYGENVKYLVDSDDVAVDISFKDVQSYKLSVSADDIKALNLPEGLAAQLSFIKNEDGTVPKTHTIMIRGYRGSVMAISRDPFAKVELTVDFDDFAASEEGVKEGDTFYGLGVNISFIDTQGVFTTDILSINAVIVADTETIE